MPILILNSNSNGNTATANGEATGTPSAKRAKILAALADLEQVLKKNPSALKDAQRLMHREQARATPHRVEPVREYKVIHKTVYCAHCGASYTRIINLTGKKDYIVVMERNGEFHEVHYSVLPKIAHIEHWVGNCTMCVDYVHEMHRDELEHRYLNLLNEISLRQQIRPLAEKEYTDD